MCESKNKIEKIKKKTRVGLKGNQHFSFCKNCGKLFYIRLKKQYILKKWVGHKLEWFCSYKCYKEFEEKK